MEGATNCISGYAAVQPRERVIIWTDGSPSVQEEVVEALVLATREAGAEVIRIVAEAPEFRLGERPGRVIEEALKAANVIVHVFGHSNAASVDNVYLLRYVFEYQARVVAVLAITRELMESEWARYPMELYWELFRRAAAQVTGEPFHLHDDLSTDLRGGLKPWPASQTGSRPAGVASNGSWTFFPSGNIPLHPESPLNGRMVFDTLEGFGVLDEPIVVDVVNHRVSAVIGDSEPAGWLRRQLRNYENADYVCELTWGIHPKVDRRLGMASRNPDTLLYRHPGVWHAGVGMWPGQGIPSVFHWDGGGMTSTLDIGDVRVIEAGRLLILEDPGLREVAAEYGDPDELLAVGTRS
jgi:2,5-dihydroxypyridine 5,6-dioxygenase